MQCRIVEIASSLRNEQSCIVNLQTEDLLKETHLKEKFSGYEQAVVMFSSEKNREYCIPDVMARIKRSAHCFLKTCPVVYPGFDS